LYQDLKSLELEKVLRVRPHNKKNWESTPNGLRASIVHFSEVPPDLVTVMWTFNKEGKSMINDYCEGHGYCETHGCGDSLG
jgi:hypothetical protein